MKLIIELDEEIYDYVLSSLEENDHLPAFFDKDLRVAVRNGTPLPKGHGRLIDEERISLSGIHFETERDHAMMIGRLNSAPTIIEADKE